MIPVTEHLKKRIELNIFSFCERFFQRDESHHSGKTGFGIGPAMENHETHERKTEGKIFRDRIPCLHG